MSNRASNERLIAGLGLLRRERLQELGHKDQSRASELIAMLDAWARGDMASLDVGAAATELFGLIPPLRGADFLSEALGALGGRHALEAEHDAFLQRIRAQAGLLE